MANVELEHLLSKVSTIQGQLGGPGDNLLKDKNQDEFNNIKIKLAETINQLSKKQEERDENSNKNGRNIGVIRLGVEIQDLITDVDLQLGQMNDTLRRQRKNPKKFPESTMEIKQQQYDKYKALVEQLKAREEGGDTLPDDKPLTLNELKFNLTGPQRQKKLDVDRELNDIEVDALKRFQENDKEIDDMVRQVDQGLDGLRIKAEMMGDAIDKQQEGMKGLEVEMEKAHQGLLTSNAKLKKVLYQYRAPNKFCMDVICVLILLGLIGVIIKLATS